MKQKFVGLDGLRGVAALAVVVYHLQGTRSPASLIPSAYLAVDLFFMLSGFVVAHAYEDRLKNGLSLYTFAKIRALRLYPLYILGCMLGLSLVVVPAVATGELWQAKRSVLALPFALVLIPFPSLDAGQWFQLNPPAWSLFYEWTLNLLYAALVVKLSNRRLIAILVLTLTLILVTLSERLQLNAPGTSPLVGASRAIFSLSLGVLGFRLWRMGHFSKLKGHHLIPTLLFLGVCLMPIRGVVAAILTTFALVIVIPAIVVMSIRPTLSKSQEQIYTVLGDLSYPIYALHWPIMMIVRRLGSQSSHPILIDVVAFASICVLSWVALHFYDRPARKHLQDFLNVSWTSVSRVRAL